MIYVTVVVILTICVTNVFVLGKKANMAGRESSAMKAKINDKENICPKLSLSRQKFKVNDRWIGTKETENLKTKYVPRNTVTSTKWAITTLGMPTFVLMVMNKFQMIC